MTAPIHPKYRRDIDGMRAIAIMMVVLFHAFPAMLPGGFTGVDIFFVISGYLISTIIFSNLQQNTFSFAGFYARRVKRIFPALLLVLSVVMVFGWFVLFPPGFHVLGKNAFNSLLFISNFALIKRVGYFDAAIEKNQLLHLWSLCVEEQYYLLWPLMAAFIFKRNRKVLTLIIAVAGLSFFANIILIYIKPVADFYLPVTRFWELLAGSLLAQITLRHGSVGHYIANRFDFSLHLINNIFSFYGIALIAAGAFMIREGNMFPGFWALLPVTGTFLLIDAGMNAGINRYILGNRWMVVIGLISYPLYLWHWPILSFANLILPEPPTTIQLVKLIGLSVFLAALTYLLLERPLRHTQKIQNKTRILLYIAGAILFFIALAYSSLIPPRLSFGTQRNQIVSSITDWEYPGDFNFNEANNFNLLVSNKSGHGSVLVIGDSHAEQYWVRLQQDIAKKLTASPVLLFATYGGCPPLVGMDQISDAQYCDNFYHFSMDFAKNNPVSNVVFAAYWEEYFGLIYTGGSEHTFTGENRRKLQLAMQQFEKDIAELQSQHKKIFIVLSNPAAKVFNPKYMISRLNGKIHTPPLDKQDYLEFTTPTRQALQDVATHTGATLIDPMITLCQETTCPSTDETGRPIYKDPDHLNKTYTLQKADFIDQVLKP